MCLPSAVYLCKGEKGILRNSDGQSWCRDRYVPENAVVILEIRFDVGMDSAGFIALMNRSVQRRVIEPGKIRVVSDELPDGL
jgi:hypothetical protein